MVWPSGLITAKAETESRGKGCGVALGGGHQDPTTLILVVLFKARALTNDIHLVDFPPIVSEGGKDGWKAFFSCTAQVSDLFPHQVHAETSPDTAPPPTSRTEPTRKPPPTDGCAPRHRRNSCDTAPRKTPVSLSGVRPKRTTRGVAGDPDRTRHRRYLLGYLL